MVTHEEIQKAIKIAKQVRKNALSYVTGRKVGVCLITQDKRFFKGCNIEHHLSAIGNCAERGAIAAAVANGIYDYLAFIVVDEKITYPCAVCAEYLKILSKVNNRDFLIISVDVLTGTIEKHVFSEIVENIYPQKFNFDTLKEYKND